MTDPADEPLEEWAAHVAPDALSWPRRWVRHANYTPTISGPLHSPRGYRPGRNRRPWR